MTTTTTTLTIDTVYFTADRERLLGTLRKANPAYDFRIGERRLGDPGFRSEYPRFEIVSECRPRHGDRLNRFAVYARRVAE